LAQKGQTKERSVSLRFLLVLFRIVNSKRGFAQLLPDVTSSLKIAENRRFENGGGRCQCRL